MSGKATTRETIRKNTVRDMCALKVYKPEYEPLIDIYAELNEQYHRLTKQYVRSDYNFEIETAQGGAKKAPIVLTLETLRKDILLYSDRLCLNPKALDSIDVPGAIKKQSALVLALTQAQKVDTG